MDIKRLRTLNAKLMLAVAIAFLFTIVAESAHAQLVRITVRLNGASEVPRVVTPGTGIARLTVNTTTRVITGTVTFSGLTTPLAAGHIHMAPARVNGPIIIPLVGRVGLRAGIMRIPPGRRLLPAQLQALRANRLYINLHTSRNPGGEIRGQIIFPRPRPVPAA